GTRDCIVGVNADNVSSQCAGAFSAQPNLIINRTLMLIFGGITGIDRDPHRLSLRFPLVSILEFWCQVIVIVIRGLHCGKMFASNLSSKQARQPEYGLVHHSDVRRSVLSVVICHFNLEWVIF